MEGHWSKNAKHGLQFEVDSYEEVIIPTREGVIAYLSSGQIKGIGPKIAERIYDAFGDMTLEVLDKEPDRLLSISGISQTKLKRICDSYLTNRGARDVVAFLAPHGVTPNRAVKLFREYGSETMDIPQKVIKLIITTNALKTSSWAIPLVQRKTSGHRIWTPLYSPPFKNRWSCIWTHKKFSTG